MPTVTFGTVEATAQTVVIRTATLADLSAINSIEQQSFTTDGFHLSQFRAALTKGRNIILMAEFEGQPAGYIWVLLHKGRPHMGRIYSIAVSPHFQGKGLAAKLLEAASQHLKALNITEFRLEVREDNTHAIQFYTHKGFTTFATAPNYYADGMTALKMRMHLK